MDVVTGAVGSLISKLGELLNEEYNLQKSARAKLDSLVKELECAHAALRKVAGVPPDQLEEQVRIWAREVRDASYDMEDEIDTFLVRVDGGHEEHSAGQESFFQRLLDTVRGLIGMPSKRRKISSAMDDISKRLEDVTRRYGRYTVVDSITVASASPASLDPRLAAMYKEVTDLVGIEKSSSELIAMLSPLGHDDETGIKMKMVSVVGVGGLGKTTLAKSVYDKLKVDFECSAFVSVGRNPDLKKVFRDILREIHKEKYMKHTLFYKESNEQQLIDELRVIFLGNKRYLLVIDDIWDSKSWETIKMALVEKNSGSRVITTTRILEVAKEAGEVYKLQHLLQSKSKRLFYTRIFGAEGKFLDNKLDEVSDKILKKCDGVPLAIITMASLLVGKSREEWIEVCSSIAFRDKDNKQVNNTEWILSLSYYDLPPHLKTCLSYLSVFPEDQIIDKDSLIWKWVAEGFVHKDKPGPGLFETAEKYFNELINRSMIQAVESGEYGMVVGCRVHDMVLDLLRHKSQEENFVTVSSNAEGMLSPIKSSRVRRLAHHNRTVEKDHHKDLGKLRSLVACSCDYTGLSLPSFELLRVLALEGCKGTGGYIYLEHLERLLHLRYLGLRGTHIKELPGEIGSLKFLQALEVGNTAVRVLPSSIGMLTQLIYLDASDNRVPDGVIEKLTSLEELHLEIRHVGQFAMELCKLSELRILKARIYDPDLSENKDRLLGDLVESIGKLHKLRHLYLTGGYSFPASLWGTGMLSGHLQSFILPRITLLMAIPACINSSDLPNLAHLDLQVSAMEDEHLKILGQLPELCHLKLQIRSKTAPKVTVTSTAADCPFQKLRYCQLYHSTVQFAINEDSSVSFTIWNGTGVMAIGSKKREECRVAPAVMPKLEVLEFGVQVGRMIHINWSSDNPGLEYLPSLRKVKVNFLTMDTDSAGRKTVKGALTNAIEVHPNRPTIEFVYFSSLCW